MNVPTPDDVFAGVFNRIVSSSEYGTILPGKAWFARRSGGKVFPYLVATVDEQKPLAEESSGKYIQRFVVELTAWAESTDTAAAATNALRAWLDRLFGWNPDDPTNGVSVPNSLAVIHVKADGGRLSLSPELRRGQDVLAAGKRIDVVVEGSRA